MSGHWARGYLGLAGADQNGGNGGGGGAMVLTVTKTENGSNATYTLSKTWKEIKDALAEGTRIVLYGEGKGELAGCYMLFTVDGVDRFDEGYRVSNECVSCHGSYEWAVLGAGNDDVFVASSEDGYPAVTVNEKG